MNKEKDNPQQQIQDLFSQMVSQTSGMFSPMDPLGAMKPLQQVAEAWTKNPQQFADAMQDWTQQIGCLLYTSPSPRDRTRSRMPSSA